MRRPSRLRCRLMDTNPGCRDMKRARSVINDKASACFSGSDSITVIWVTGCLSVRMCGMDDLACIGKDLDIITKLRRPRYMARGQSCTKRPLCGGTIWRLGLGAAGLQ